MADPAAIRMRQSVLTDLILPTAGPRSFSITSQGDAPSISGITIHALKSAR